MECPQLAQEEGIETERHSSLNIYLCNRAEGSTPLQRTVNRNSSVTSSSTDHHMQNRVSRPVTKLYKQEDVLLSS